MSIAPGNSVIVFLCSFHRRTFKREKEKKKGERTGEDRRCLRNTVIERYFLPEPFVS